MKGSQGMPNAIKDVPKGSSLMCVCDATTYGFGGPCTCAETHIIRPTMQIPPFAEPDGQTFMSARIWQKKQLRRKRQACPIAVNKSFSNRRNDSRYLFSDAIGISCKYDFVFACVNAGSLSKKRHENLDKHIARHFLTFETHLFSGAAKQVEIHLVDILSPFTPSPVHRRFPGLQC